MVRVVRIDKGFVRVLAGVAGAGAACCAGGAMGQAVPVVSQPVVQAVPGNAGSVRLNEALGRIGRNSRDVAALIDAGNAALALGDTDAAIGFFRKADGLSPGNAGAKAGIARAYVEAGDPVAAIPWFNAAAQAGASDAEFASERGLAYDLVGDNATAQRYYNAAMAAAGAAGASDAVRMRLAISQAIGGDQKAAETTLMPLLRKQDKPGWRTRAFALAIGGDVAQAVDLSQRILPPQLAENIAPYLRYMPRLTKAQQAAAANLGRFPRASEIGFDDPRIAAFAPPRLAAADAPLVPKGEPLDRGRKPARPVKVAKAENAPAISPRPSRGDPVRAATVPSSIPATVPGARTAAVAPAPARVAPPEVRPTIESTGELPAIGATTPATPAAVPAATVPPPVQTPSAASPPPQPARREPSSSPTPTSAPAVAPTSATPGFDLARLTPAAPEPAVSAAPPPAATTPPAVTPPAATPPAAGAAPQPSFAAIFADFGNPVVQAVPAAGAVDIREIKATKAPPKPDPKLEEKAKAAEKAKAEKAKADEKARKKPTPPTHPSRIWVQIGVGRDKDAIAFDWRRYSRQAPALFKGRQPWVSDMGRTNRILAGPFATQKAADQFLADLKKAGITGGMPWTSPAGQVVDALPAGKP